MSSISGVNENGKTVPTTLPESFSAISGEAKDIYVPPGNDFTAFKLTRASPATTPRMYLVVFLPSLAMITMHFAACSSRMIDQPVLRFVLI